MTLIYNKALNTIKTLCRELYLDSVADKIDVYYNDVNINLLHLYRLIRKLSLNYC